MLFRYRLASERRTGWKRTQRELNYPKLPPGQYTLEVMARNAQGLWSAEPARLHFPGADAVVAEWWFRLASVIADAGASAGCCGRGARSRLEAERYRLENAVTERTRELSRGKAARDRGEELARNSRTAAEIETTADGGAAGQPVEERISGQHEPRNPHADERHPGHDRSGAGDAI